MFLTDPVLCSYSPSSSKLVHESKVGTGGGGSRDMMLLAVGTGGFWSRNIFRVEVGWLLSKGRLIMSRVLEIGALLLCLPILGIYISLFPIYELLSSLLAKSSHKLTTQLHRC